MKRLLVLGAGLVSPPLIRYFLGQDQVHLTVVSLDFSRIEPLAGAHGQRVALVRASIDDHEQLRALFRASDGVVSLLPAPLLGGMASLAVEERRHLVSTSYTTDAVRSLDREARAAGILLLNEMGFDPGLDHMTAMRTIAGIRRTGGSIVRLTSAAGGLPAPEANDNPWGYKFSWSPRGVITAMMSDARFLRDGQVVEVRAADLPANAGKYEIEGLGEMEIYPNRDALPYRELYDIGEVRDLFRGTIRFPGWCATMSALARLGYLDTEVRAQTTYEAVARRKVGGGEIITSVASFLGLPPDSPVVARLVWAGLLADEQVEINPASSLDLLVARLEKRLRYDEDQRDMAVLEHHFGATWPDGRREELQSGILAFGDPAGDSAMSRLVGLPAAIAAHLILKGALTVSGVQIPVIEEIYEPVLQELAAEGVSVATASS